MGLLEEGKEAEGWGPTHPTQDRNLISPSMVCILLLYQACTVKSSLGLPLSPLDKRTRSNGPDALHTLGEAQIHEVSSPLLAKE